MQYYNYSQSGDLAVTSLCFLQLRIWAKLCPRLATSSVWQAASFYDQEFDSILSKKNKPSFYDQEFDNILSKKNKPSFYDQEFDSILSERRINQVFMTAAALFLNKLHLSSFTSLMNKSLL